MIAFDSPLRRLPPGIEGRQVLILDGVRHAAEMAGLAHERLRCSLTVIATDAVPSDTQESADLITTAYLDAWSIVDSIDRLRSLFQLLPEHGKPTGMPARFAEQLQYIRNLRNVSDHLAQRIDYVLARGTPALGRLSWFTLTGADEGVSCLLVPGTLRPARGVGIINPGGRAIRPPTGLITLAAGEHEASLCDALATAQAIVEAVERGVRLVVSNHSLDGQHVGADLTIRLSMSFFNPDQPQKDA